MTGNDKSNLIDALDDLLDREKQALLSGDLDLLGRLLTDKEALLARMNSQDVSSDDDLNSVYEKLASNQILLVSAQAGIRSVVDRIAEIRKAQGGLETYDKSGRRNRHSTGLRRCLEKRA